MTDTRTARDTLFGHGDTDRLAPLAGPRRGFDPWIVSYGWVDGWVLDMCDARDPRDWMRDAPAPRPTPLGTRLRQWLRALRRA